MNRYLIPFTIPLSGSKHGITEYHFQCDANFLACFPESPVQSGSIDVKVDLDKRTDTLQLFFALRGTLDLECDRCLAEIAFPIETDFNIILKSGDSFEEIGEVVVLPVDTKELNIAQFIYEFIVLSIPTRKKFDCESVDPRPCNMTALSYLMPDQPDVENKEMDDSRNPFQDLLNDLK